MIYTTIVLCIGLGVGPAWSQSELDHPAERKVTLPDGSVRPIRLGGGPAIGQTEVGQLERRVTLPDGSLGTIRVPIWSSQAEGYPSQGIQSALERYREAGDDTPDRAAIRAEVEQYLNEEYDRHLAVHVEQLEELESRLNKLRQQLERRQAAKAKLVELKLELMLSQADGLGWPEATNPPGWQEFGPQASSFRGSASPFEMPGGPNTQPNNNPFNPPLMPNTRPADPAFPGAAYPSQPPAERRPNDAYAPPMPAASVPFEPWNPNNTLPGVPSAYQGLQGMPPSRNQQSFPTPPETGLGRRPASGAGRPLPVSLALTHGCRTPHRLCRMGIPPYRPWRRGKIRLRQPCGKHWWRSITITTLTTASRSPRSQSDSRDHSPPTIHQTSVGESRCYPISIRNTASCSNSLI